jgi:myosin-5
LDIFGFEIFEKNSFEQLCINYANERLQQLFNLATFRAEEDAYRAEGVPFEPVMFADNQEVLDLIDKKPCGILPLLDEEVVLPRTTDDTFLRKLGEKHERKHPRYERPRGSASRTGFAVRKTRRRRGECRMAPSL